MGQLRRSLGLGSLAFYGVGLILGAGIYSILGEAAGAAGEALWLSFLLGSLAALLTGLSYAELETMFPRAGAEYVYARKAWPTAGWLPGTLGWVLVAAAVALNVVGANEASWVNIAFTLIEVAGLVALIFVGTRDPDFAHVFVVMPHAGVLGGASLIFFAYLGFDDRQGAIAGASDSLGTSVGTPAQRRRCASGPRSPRNDVGADDRAK